MTIVKRIPGSFRAIRRMRQAKPTLLGSVGKTALAAATAIILLVLVSVFLAGLEFSTLASTYPDVSSIETYLGSPGRGVFIPTRFYDRTGTNLLYEAVHPYARSRRWLGTGNEGDTPIPDLVAQATLASQPGAFDSPELFDSLLSTNPPEEKRCPSIAEQLLDMSIFRLNTKQTHKLEFLIRNLLIYEFQASYSEEQQLEWYLNAAYYGNMAYGFDAAGLVYFGKHARELSLAEIAMLASIPLNARTNPVDNPVDAREAQETVLERMQAEGLISKREAEQALNEPLALQDSVKEAVPDELAVFWQALATAAPDIEHHLAMSVTTSIDQLMQEKASCVVQEVVRVSSGETEEIPEAFCQIDPDLMPIQSSVTDLSPDIVTGSKEPSWMIMDPHTGEILALGGDVLETHPIGSAVDPVLYLAAYAHGYSPATMVLDIPDGRPDFQDDMFMYQGPVRMRTALKNGLPGARRQVANLVGFESMTAVSQQLGLSRQSFLSPEEEYEELLGIRTSLLNLAQIHSVWANNGKNVGSTDSIIESHNEGFAGLNPFVIKQVDDAGGPLLELETQERFVVSRQLAFLLTNSLQDTAFQLSDPIYPSAFSNRSWASHLGTGGDGSEWWVMGSSPDYVIGVWMGSQPGLQTLSTISGSPPITIWNGLAAAAAGTADIGEWEIPPGLEWVEVCDPSGLLPTADCPVVVREVYISGSEPRLYDNMYERVQIHRETGRLATVYTPETEIVEKVVLKLPYSIQQTNRSPGFEEIPGVYEPIMNDDLEGDKVRIAEPAPFENVNKLVSVEVVLESTDFVTARLVYGEGLNPDRWTLVEEKSLSLRQSTVRWQWDTEDLSGLYVLQAVLLDESGQVTLHSIPVLVDNSPPEADINIWAVEEPITHGDEVVVEVSAADNYGIKKVELYLDNEDLAEWENPPYNIRLFAESGAYELYARVTDTAGLTSETEPVTLKVE